MQSALPYMRREQPCIDREREKKKKQPIHPFIHPALRLCGRRQGGADPSKEERKRKGRSKVL